MLRYAGVAVIHRFRDASYSHDPLLLLYHSDQLGGGVVDDKKK